MAAFLLSVYRRAVAANDGFPHLVLKNDVLQARCVKGTQFMSSFT